MFTRLKRWHHRVTHEEVERLRSALAGVEDERRRRSGCGTDAQDDVAKCRAEAEERVFKKAPDVTREELGTAWSALKAASRATVSFYNATELADAAVATRVESAAKLHDWRLAAVDRLLGPDVIGDGRLPDRISRIERVLGLRPESVHPLADRLHRAETQVPCQPEEPGASGAHPDMDASASRAGCLESRVEQLENRLGIGLRDGVVRSREILDEHLDNVYRKLGMLRSSVCRTATTLMLALVMLIVVVALDWAGSAIAVEESDPTPVLGSWQLLLVVLVLGSLGAVISSATNLADHDWKQRAPDQMVGMSLMVMRPLVGAASAAVVVIVIQSGSPAGVKINEAAVFVLAVAAGFVERWATKVVVSAAAAANR